MKNQFWYENAQQYALILDTTSFAALALVALEELL